MSARMSARMSTRPRRHSQSGFTLVETLVAFAILASILTVVFGGMTRMLNGGYRAETLREAVLLAQGKLDGLGIIDPIVAGESMGQFGNGLAWRLRIVPTSVAANMPVAGAWADITVTAAGDTRGRPMVALATYKLVRVARR